MSGQARLYLAGQARRPTCAQQCKPWSITNITCLITTMPSLDHNPVTFKK